MEKTQETVQGGLPTPEEITEGVREAICSKTPNAPGCGGSSSSGGSQ